METTHDNEGSKNQARIATHAGGCHCGAVRFEFDADLSQGPSRCNCSVCTKIAPTGLIVKPNAFRLVSGEADLSAYVWGAKISQRLFCKHCGVHCFGRGHLEQIGGDFVSVNLNCVDGFDPSTVPVIYWDGRHDNWAAGPRSTPWPVAVPSAP
jgi:hypothetical protein